MLYDLYYNLLFNVIKRASFICIHHKSSLPLAKYLDHCLLILINLPPCCIICIIYYNLLTFYTIIPFSFLILLNHYNHSIMHILTVLYLSLCGSRNQKKQKSGDQKFYNNYLKGNPVKILTVPAEIVSSIHYSCAKVSFSGFWLWHSDILCTECKH